MDLDYSNDLPFNIHNGLPLPDDGESFLIRGNYQYWHYGCDGFNDRGWGCGYRTLQTICSWIILNKALDAKVPSIRKIQEILVQLEDKDNSFLGSNEWIGSFEVCIILNHLYDIDSKIIHVPSGKELDKYMQTIRKHFQDFGSPVMMGGDRDCSSKCIAGMHVSRTGTYLLIIDPHFVGRARNVDVLQYRDWIKWQHLNDFVASSFYNLCLPQMKYLNSSGI